MPLRHKLPILSAVLALLMGLAACVPGDLRETLEQQKPRVTVAGQHLTQLDFSQATLAFDLKVANPNPVAIQLAGLDYGLKLAGQPFVSGKQGKQMKLAASGDSRFTLPLSLRFEDIYKALGQLKGRNTIPYELSTGLMIDVPLLGKLRYPASISGELPIPQLPKVAVKSLSLEKLTFSGANLLLNLQVDNPNVFGFNLGRLHYDFRVNGKQWLSAKRSGIGQIAKQGKSQITIPLNLNFMELGSSLYGLLQGGEPLNYSLSGQLLATSDHPLIGNFETPFQSSGTVTLAR